MTILNITKMDTIYAIELHRPDKHNALNTALTRQLLDELTRLREQPDCRVIVLFGNGPSFCSGADIGEFKGFQDSQDAAAQRALLTTQLHEVFSQTPQPIIGALYGNALGGGAGLALACDLVFCEENTRFGYPEIRQNVVPAIVMANLVRQLPVKKAFELISTCRILNGQEMVEWGLANQCLHGKEAVLQAALGTAELIAKSLPVAVQEAKKLFYYALDTGFSDGLQAGRDLNIYMRNFKK